MNWVAQSAPSNAALLAGFAISGMGLCLSAGIGALARWAGPERLFALCGAVFAAAFALLPYGMAEYCSPLCLGWFSAFAGSLAFCMLALYLLLQMRSRKAGFGHPRTLVRIPFFLAAIWLLVSPFTGPGAIRAGTALVLTAMPLIIIAAELTLQKRRVKIEKADLTERAALAALGVAALFCASGLFLPSFIVDILRVPSIGTAAALFTAGTVRGVQKSPAAAGNRILRLSTKSLEAENRQLADMAARLEFERNRLQQRRADLEKENRQAEERIRELCTTADAFYALGQSIDYAGRIQQALVPSEVKLRQTLGESFILNLPRDKVSGDFLWCTSFDDGWTMLCVADCTGHGVPGAFMSALGTMLLGQIVTERGIRRPEQILADMDRNLRSALSSNGGDIQDGMEAGILMLSPRRNQAIFAGARHSLYKARNGECEVVPGVRRAIGGRLRTEPRPFTALSMPLHSGEMLYLASDGYQDQLGGPQDRRYLSRRFQDTLAWVAALPVDEQRAALLTSHTQWRGKRDQTDDIVVVGIRA